MVAFETLHAVAGVMAGYAGPWFVCGGWAIDLWVGRVTREHADLEVGVARRDQGALRDHMAGWTLSKAVQRPEGGAWVPWTEGEWLELPIHQVQACREGAEPPEFEFFLNEVEDGVWHWRRNPALTVPAGEVSITGAAGIPFVAPQIQLLYKATGHRPKDEHDFATALPLLRGEQRAWLRAALERYHPGDAWIARLA